MEQAVVESEEQLCLRLEWAIQRSESSSWEVADGFKGLNETGWTQKRIGARFGFTQGTVSKYVSCSRKYSPENNRPRFSEAFDEFSSKPANYSSESNEWYTPPQYVYAAREVMGGIDLDPASCSKAQEWIRADRFFTEAGDGLALPWEGRVWLNPPYGTVAGESQAGLFCRKAIKEHEEGRAKAVIVLVNSVHSQQWQAPLYKYPVCFVDHRISFLDEKGEENPNPTFQNIFVYLGPDPMRFASVFSAFGYVMGRLS